MDAEQDEKLKAGKAMLLQVAIHWLRGCCEVALEHVSQHSKSFGGELTSESTLQVFLVSDRKRDVIA